MTARARALGRLLGCNLWFGRSLGFWRVRRSLGCRCFRCCFGLGRYFGFGLGRYFGLRRYFGVSFRCRFGLGRYFGFGLRRRFGLRCFRLGLRRNLRSLLVHLGCGLGLDLVFTRIALVLCHLLTASPAPPGAQRES